MTPAGRVAGQPTPADFSAETFARIVALHAAAGEHVLSEAALDVSRGEFLAAHRSATDLWVFGYGSLMWNPGIPVAESRPARLDGHRRGFCVEVRSGRASPDRPGLVLGLVPGGSCLGIAHRIAASDLVPATAVLWRREMTWGTYRAAWVPIELAGSPVRALTFLTESSHAAYHPGLTLDEQAARIAVAEGIVGTNRDYLHRTRATLVEAGVADPYVEALCDLIDAAEVTGAREPSVR